MFYENIEHSFEHAASLNNWSNPILEYLQLQAGSILGLEPLLFCGSVAFSGSLFCESCTKFKALLFLWFAKQKASSIWRKWDIWEANKTADTPVCL